MLAHQQNPRVTSGGIQHRSIRLASRLVSDVMNLKPSLDLMVPTCHPRLVRRAMGAQVPKTSYEVETWSNSATTALWNNITLLLHRIQTL